MGVVCRQPIRGQHFWQKMLPGHMLRYTCFPHIRLLVAPKPCLPREIPGIVVPRQNSSCLMLIPGPWPHDYIERGTRPTRQTPTRTTPPARAVSTPRLSRAQGRRRARDNAGGLGPGSQPRHDGGSGTSRLVEKDIKARGVRGDWRGALRALR